MTIVVKIPTKALQTLRLLDRECRKVYSIFFEEQMHCLMVPKSVWDNQNQMVDQFLPSIYEESEEVNKKGRVVKTNRELKNGEV